MTPGSLVTLLAYLVATVVLVAEARRRRLVTEGMALIGIWGLVGGVLGARLAHWLLVEPGALVSHPAGLLDPRYGGRTILGGVLGGWLAVEWAKRRLGIRRSTGDLFAPALAAGEAVGRVGCYLNGCCYGKATTVPWAVWQHDAWRHPVQLYTAALAAGLYCLLVWARGRLPREGDLFRAYLVLWGLGRFVLEFWRDSGAAWLGLSMAQWAGVGVAGAGSWLLLRRGA